MDLLLKVVTARNLLILAALAGLAALWTFFEEYPRRLYHEWRYPPQAGAPGGGEAIMAEIERRQALQVEARFRRLWARLDEAQARGLEARGLKAKARAALALNGPQFRRQALRALNEVELALQRPKEAPRPAPAEEEEAIPEDVPPSRVVPKGRR